MSNKVVLSSTADQRTVSLLQWTRDTLLDGATTAFFGNALLKIEPNLFESFSDFDDNSWKLTYRIPRPWSNDMYAAKQKAQNALATYFALPKEQRPGETWMVRTLETEMRGLGIESPDIAAFLMMVYWVINGNPYKLCFWILAYILHDPLLLASVRKEIQPAVRASSSANDLAERLDRCPHLDSIFHEVLRLTSSSSSIRNVLSPLVVGGKYLRAGNKVLIPYRQLHVDETVFGANVRSFDPDRFLKNKLLTKSSSYRPFGGGSTLCPGRFLARREVLTFVALVLDRFDLELAATSGSGGKGEKEKAFPRLEDRTPSLGIMGPANGYDVALLVSPAKLMVN